MTGSRYLSAALIMLAVLLPKAHADGAYFAWGQGGDGYGYCYEYAEGGGVLNNGSAMPNGDCSGAYFAFGVGGDGYGYCYEYGGGHPLNAGAAVNNSLCGG